MKKLLQISVALSLLSLAISAQNRSRLVDNFDMASGVKIKSANAPVAPSNSSAPRPDKKLVKKTAQTVMSMQDAVSLKNNANSSASKLTMKGSSSMKGFTTGDSTIDAYIAESSARYGIDPLLIYSQMHQESAFKLRATSYKGARGLMQLMPATAMRFGVTDIYDPRQNIDAGVKYMRWLLDKFGGDVNLALAGYNAGEGAVMKYGNSIPPYNETREYVRRITARYNSIRTPGYVNAAKRATVSEVAKLDKKGVPLNVYERNPITVRLPDGRMRLVNQ